MLIQQQMQMKQQIQMNSNGQMIVSVAGNLNNSQAANATAGRKANHSNQMQPNG